MMAERVSTAAMIVAGHINVSTPVAISERDFLAALRTGVVPPLYEHHVHAFFDETDLATITDLMIEGAATYGQLADLADRLLPERHETWRWLDERRAF